MKMRPFRLERYFAKYEFHAPYLLCSSDCESLSVGDLLAYEPGAEEALRELWLGYTEARGAPSLREQIAQLYDGISAEQLLVHAGAEEAIFNFMHVALSPGDQIVVHAPYYQSLGEVAHSIGAEVVEWRGDPERAWALDLGLLGDLMTERTKVVVLNIPHNPTGWLPDLDFLHGLSALSDEHGFVVFCDEVYRGLTYETSSALPSFSDINARSVALGVMSKTYGLAGLRIGWTATQDKALDQALASFKDYTTICNSGPSEFLATIALKHRAPIVERNLSIIRENLVLLDDFFARHVEHFAWQMPIAGPIAFPRYLGADVESFCRELVEQEGVLLLPGTLYGEEYSHVRIGFGRRQLPEGLARLDAFLTSA